MEKREGHDEWNGIKLGTLMKILKTFNSILWKMSRLLICYVEDLKTILQEFRASLGSKVRTLGVFYIDKGGEGLLLPAGTQVWGVGDQLRCACVC